MRTFLTLLGLALVAVLARMSFFTVDPTEFVYVTQLGQHVGTFDGAADNDAGLHVRWPWPVQSVQRLDRRLQVFDLPVTELLTLDPEQQRIGKTLTAETFACWRIGGRDDVDRFIRRIGTPEQARAILGQHINSELNAFTSKMPLEDLISKKPGQAERKMRELREYLMNTLKSEVRREYGIELVDVRLRRFNHPKEVRNTIFERIRSERGKMVAEIQSKGDAEAKNIKSAAAEQARNMLAEARSYEERQKGQADADAALIRNQAHSQDPEFYVFLKKMDRLYNILAENKTVLLLSTHRDWFDLLYQPPHPAAKNGKGGG
jgi:membrane protease subunit HflC